MYESPQALMGDAQRLFQGTPVLDGVSNKIQDFLATEKELATAKTSVSMLATEIEGINTKIATISEDFETHQLASAFLKELIRVVSTENIDKIEHLVNSALSNIFPERGLTFRINSVVRRNLTEYEFQLIRGKNVEATGDMESNGGGVWAVVAFVLKTTFNVLSKRFPLLVLDESLSFVSEKHILGTSKLIHELAEQFNISVLLVTHQKLFVESCSSSYLLQAGDGCTEVKKVK